MSRLDSEIIIIGSGASGVHTALPLVEAGRKVLMIDIGDGEKKTDSVPSEDWKTLRQTDDEQWKYFLGEEFEGLPLGPVRVGAQLTPGRQYIHRNSESVLPLYSEHFAAMQATCAGGLGTAWGASSMPFSDADLKGWPIRNQDLRPHYKAVAEHTGFCGPDQDDLTDFLGNVNPTQKPAGLDSNAEYLLGRYGKRKSFLNDEGLYVGRSRLAMKTAKPGQKNRDGLRYLDMEFWGDADGSVYRPAKTLEELKTKPNFQYEGNLCCLSISEDENGIQVVLQNTDTGEILHARSKHLFLAAGAINSARIAMRSFDHYHESVPILSNPYSYYPCFNLFRLGQLTKNRRHSLTQLTMLYDHDGRGESLVQPQLYSYRSLLLFKLIKESPLPTRESIRLFQAIQDYLAIIGVFHEDRPTDSKELILRKGEQPESDWAEIRYQRSEQEVILQREKEESLCKLFRKLGAFPIKRINPGDGASIHYAGTLPMTEEERTMTLDQNGLLRNTKSVYVTDGASFPHLPAKGLTMTLMANARRIASSFLSKS